jgi:thiamine pyrophosphate-dependent acetolactate synthase large subunit-like protein
MSESRLSDELGVFTGVDIAPAPDYAMIARACGGWGRKVEDPADVLPALKEGLKEVRNSRVAVIDVHLTRGLTGKM